MLRKLLKYDLAAVWRIWWLLLIILPALSLSTGITLRLISLVPDDSNLAFLNIFAILAFYLFYFVMVGGAILTEILIFWRFYKHFYTDEGYLTFTLPVSRRALFLSKTLNAMIWNALLAVVEILSILLIGVFIPKDSPNSFVLSLSVGLTQSLGTTISETWEQIGAWMIVYALLILLLVALAILFSVTLLHFCITVGSILVNKGKLFLSIGIYYGVNSTLSSIITIGSIFTVVPFIVAFSELYGDLSPFRMHASISLMLLIVCAIEAALSVTLYCMTLNKIERKLNLQ